MGLGLGQPDTPLVRGRAKVRARVGVELGLRLGLGLGLGLGVGLEPATHQVRLGSLSGTQSAIIFLAAASSIAKRPKPRAVPSGAEAEALHATGAPVTKPGWG